MLIFGLQGSEDRRLGGREELLGWGRAGGSGGWDAASQVSLPLQVALGKGFRSPHTEMVRCQALRECPERTVLVGDGMRPHWPSELLPWQQLGSQDGVETGKNVTQLFYLHPASLHNTIRGRFHSSVSRPFFMIDPLRSLFGHSHTPYSLLPLQLNAKK